MKILINILLFIFFINESVFAQGADTVVFYYRYIIPGYEYSGSRRVKTSDSADYFQVILPPDSGQTQYNIKELYKSGAIRMVGKIESYSHLKEDILSYDGQCVAFYPDGKRRSIISFEHGYKKGMEYEYFPTGKLYFTKINNLSIRGDDAKFVDCFDSNGNQVAKGGNGHWIVYDTDFRNIFISGEIKNGNQDGEWKGETWDSDSIKFIYLYKKGELVSAKGYDKTGREYSFKQTAVPATYKFGVNVFVSELRNHIKLPKDNNGKKIRDTISISFIVQKDGHLSDFAVIGNPNPSLAEAVLSAVKDCKNWEPRTYYGIPIRSKITIPLDLNNSGFGSQMYSEEMIDVQFEKVQQSQ